jgi:hypothetical protein
MFLCIRFRCQNLNARTGNRQQCDPEDMPHAIISISNGDCNQVQDFKMYRPNTPGQTPQRYLKGDKLLKQKVTEN